MPGHPWGEDSIGRFVWHRHHHRHQRPVWEAFGDEQSAWHRHPRRQLRVWEASASERSVWRNHHLRLPEVRHLRALLEQPVPRHRRRVWAAVEVEQSVLPEPLRQGLQGRQLLEVQPEPAQRQRQVWEAGSDAPFPSLKAWEAN